MARLPNRGFRRPLPRSLAGRRRLRCSAQSSSENFGSARSADVPDQEKGRFVVPHVYLILLDGALSKTFKRIGPSATVRIWANPETHNAYAI